MIHRLADVIFERPYLCGPLGAWCIVSGCYYGFVRRDMSDVRSRWPFAKPVYVRETGGLAVFHGILLVCVGAVMCAHAMGRFPPPEVAGPPDGAAHPSGGVAVR